ncbi:MAG TPA: S8 family serine peptidase [Myxococcales bacterium]|nr:S8 family serine peptidase [Myxococcales bacterium]
MKLNPFFAVVPALLALAACNAPTTEPADETGSIDSELASQVRYIIHFGSDQAAGRAALGMANAKVALELPSVNAVAVTLPARAVAALQNNPAFSFVEEDVPRYPLSQTTPYGITMTQVDQVWPTTTGGTKVCVIDSGAYVNQEDLVGNSFTGYASGTGNWYEDSCGHGSHVTGTIAAQNNAVGVVGVNTAGIAIHAVKVFNGTDCLWTYSSTLVDAAERCLQSGAKVVSMSLGGGAKSRAEENEFKKLWNAGVLSVAAAGNSGTTQMSYPASYPIVVSVAAVDSNKALATFSQRNREVDIAAPGVAVLSTVPWSSTNTVTVGGSTYSGSGLDGAASSSGTTGALASGGLCDSVGSWAGQVVLCERGVIAFADKVNNVKAGGGVAAIIYNNAPGGFLGTLNGTSTIPAISISQEDGQAIIAGGGVGQSATVVSVTVAPGSGYEAWDGTSMATPHVSGIAALIWSAYPGKSVSQVRTALEATAEDLGAAGRDNSFGNGLVRAKAALDYLGSH